MWQSRCGFCASRRQPGKPRRQRPVRPPSEASALPGAANLGCGSREKLDQRAPGPMREVPAVAAATAAPPSFLHSASSVLLLNWRAVACCRCRHPAGIQGQHHQLCRGAGGAGAARLGRLPRHRLPLAVQLGRRAVQLQQPCRAAVSAIALPCWAGWAAVRQPAGRAVALWYTWCHLWGRPRPCASLLGLARCLLTA